MRLAAATFLCAAFVSMTAHADDTLNSSLFFNSDETKRVEFLAAQQPSQIVSSDIYLGAIMYYGPDTWRVWMLNRSWSPVTKDDKVQITSVQPNLVRIHLAERADFPARDITLKLHQTWRASTGQIAEGNP